MQTCRGYEHVPWNQATRRYYLLSWDLSKHQSSFACFPMSKLEVRMMLPLKDYHRND